MNGRLAGAVDRISDPDEDRRRDHSPRARENDGRNGVKGGRIGGTDRHNHEADARCRWSQQTKEQIVHNGYDGAAEIIKDFKSGKDFSDPVLRDYTSSSFLPDICSFVFAPGWDVTYCNDLPITDPNIVV